MSLFPSITAPSRRQLQVFGMACALALISAGTVKDHRHGFSIPVGALWALGAACAVIAALRPAALRGIYVAAVKGTAPIGVVASTVMLAVVYFGVITPLAVVGRWRKKDPLALRIDRGSKTYWKSRPAPPAVERYLRQY